MGGQRVRPNEGPNGRLKEEAKGEGEAKGDPKMGG